MRPLPFTNDIENSMHDSAEQHFRLCLGTCLVTALFGISIFVSSADVHAQGSLIESFKPAQVVAGDWRVVDGELVVGADAASRAVVATKVSTSYALTVEFTRTEGNNSVGVILPVGSSQCAFIMSVFNGEAHGIGIIDGKLARDNVSTINPGKIETDHPYRLLIEVDVKDSTVAIASTLDGRPFLEWSGQTRSLSMLERWKMPSTSNVGLITFAPTRFHKITVTPLDRTMRMTQRTPSTNANDGLTEGSGTKVLYPQGHGEPTIDSLKRIANRSSLFFNASREPVSSESLVAIDILFIRVPKTQITKPEVDAIVAFVRGGGSLLLVMDEERRSSLMSTGVNEIIRPFGLAFTDDIEYLHNCGAICKAGDIHSSDREVPFSGGRGVTGGSVFGYQLDEDGNTTAAFATTQTTDGGGRIIILADGMAAGLMGTSNGQRLSGVTRNPAKTTYWGKDSAVFLTEVIDWLAKDK